MTIPNDKIKYFDTSGNTILYSAKSLEVRYANKIECQDTNYLEDFTDAVEITSKSYLFKLLLLNKNIEVLQHAKRVLTEENGMELPNHAN